MQLEFKKETVLNGVPVSGGVSFGKVCLFNEARHRNMPVYKVFGEGTDREIGRVRRALRLASDRLGLMAKDVESRIGKAESDILAVQQLILDDENLHLKIFDEIEKQGVNAEAAITRVFERHEQRINRANSEHIRERAADIGEIKRKLLDVLGNLSPSLLCEGNEHCQRGKNRIVVAEELTPSLTLELDTQHTIGFITEKGGATSHAAILANALGIPAVSGIKGIRSALMCGTEMLINGNTGEVIVWPSKKRIEDMPALLKHPESLPAATPPVDGFRVMANISRYSAAEEARQMQAEGIGLYRTEFDLLAENRMLAEDELYELYIRVLEVMDGQPVIFRMFDLGADKTAPFLGTMNEENPSLGFRGSRLLLARQDLMVPQARALARASEKAPIRVMYPMIVEVEQFLAIKKRFEEFVSGIKTGQIMHGPMLEVPSACLQAEALMQVADFCSVGTNDLVQYLFAVDRNNEKVSYDYHYDRAVFWTLMKDMAAASGRTGTPLSVCGELAADPAGARKLKDAGITSVSVNARAITAVRDGVR